MRSNWRSFIQPDNAIRTNWNGSKRRVIAKLHYRRPNCRQLDLPSYISDRVSGHYGVEVIRELAQKTVLVLNTVASAVEHEQPINPALVRLIGFLISAAEL